MSKLALPPHQQRVIDEKKELQERIEKLSNFIGDAIYYKLEEVDQILLDTQLSAMKMYSEILYERVKRFRLPPQSK